VTHASRLVRHRLHKILHVDQELTKKRQIVLPITSFFPYRV